MKDHYTKEELIDDVFLFISYKHDDKNGTVDDILTYLYEQGVRFWYDADLVIGDKWTEIAEELILHENCAGVLFFNSVESFTSGPVNTERGLALRKQEKCRKAGKPFYIFPVNMGKPSVLELIRAVFDKYTDTDALKRDFKMEYLHNIAALFDSDIIYCYTDPNNQAGYLQSLMTMINKNLPKVINKSVQRMKQIEKQISNGESRSFRFGVCKDKLSEAVPPALLVRDGALQLPNGSYIVQNGRAFTVKKLAWRLLYCADDRYVLLAENTIALRCGGRDIPQWLQENFVPYAFTEEEREKLLEVRLLNAEDVRRTNAQEKLAFPPDPENPEGHWWLEDMAQGALQKVIKKDGKVFPAGYNMRTKKSGIRPVIVVDQATMTSILEK